MKYTDKDIINWIKRSNRKKAKLLQKEKSPEGFLYRIIYSDKGKVKIGWVEDGMRLRYGISCQCSMSTTSLGSLWSCDLQEGDIEIMQSYLKNELLLPCFDFNILDNLVW